MHVVGTDDALAFMESVHLENANHFVSRDLFAYINTTSQTINDCAFIQMFNEKKNGQLSIIVESS